jgi:hypothetical protein
VVFDDYGLTRQQNQPGKFVRATFSLTNLQERGASVTGADFELADSSEQTYHSDFQMRQVQGSTSQPFDGSTIGPGASVLLMLIFDVAPDANDLMLRVRSR